MIEVILLTLGILCVGYTILVTLWVGWVSANAIVLAAGIGFAGFYFFCRYFQHSAWLPPVKRVVYTVLVSVAVVFFVSLGFVISGALEKDEKPADYIVVLGAGLRGDQLSLTLRLRMDAALACEQGETIVVSGGQGVGETISEAEAMGRFLLENGIPEDRILAENKSTSTDENLEFSKKLIESDSGKPLSELRIKVISSDFHCYRAKLLAGRHGYEQVSTYGGETNPLLVPAFYIREGLALIKSFLFDR